MKKIQLKQIMEEKNLAINEVVREQLGDSWLVPSTELFNENGEAYVSVAFFVAEGILMEAGGN